MDARFLLDTSIVSDLVRHPQGRIAGRVAREGERTVCTSIVVAAKRGSARLTAQLEAVLSALEVFSFEEPADRHYAALRNQLEQQGTPIGPNDLLIAAHALALGVAVVTDDVRGFARVPDLRVENWLAD